jgi:hypothetical protein
MTAGQEKGTSRQSENNPQAWKNSIIGVFLGNGIM